MSSETAFSVAINSRTLNTTNIKTAMYQNSNKYSTLSEDKPLDEPLGVDGKFEWPVRVGTVLLFGAVLLVNYILGVNSNKEVSDKFHLWVTPPGLFFSIWGVIYTGVLIAVIYNLVKNEWNLHTHIYFGVSNLINIAWTLAFDVGTTASVTVASLLLIAIAVFLLLTWTSLGLVSESRRNAWAYITRNVFAFYLGWVIAAANINFGMVLVYWWGVSKQTQTIIFWIMAPLCAVAVTFANFRREGIYGLKCCFTLWISVVWAFVGAAITTSGCQEGSLDLC